MSTLADVLLFMRTNIFNNLSRMHDDAEDFIEQSKDLDVVIDAVSSGVLVYCSSVGVLGETFESRTEPSTYWKLINL